MIDFCPRLLPPESNIYPLMVQIPVGSMFNTSHHEQIESKPAAKYDAVMQKTLKNHAKAFHEAAERHTQVASRAKEDKEKSSSLRTAASYCLREAAFHKILGTEENEKFALRKAQNTMELLKVLNNSTMDSDEAVEAIQGELAQVYGHAEKFQRALQSNDSLLARTTLSLLTEV